MLYIIVPQKPKACQQISSTIYADEIILRWCRLIWFFNVQSLEVLLLQMKHSSLTSFWIYLSV